VFGWWLEEFGFEEALKPRTVFPSDILLLPACPLLPDPSTPPHPCLGPEFDAVDTLYMVLEMV